MGQHNTDEYGGGTAQTTNATLTPAAWFSPQKGKGYLIEASIVGVNEAGTEMAAFIVSGSYLVSPAGVITLLGSVTVLHTGGTATYAGTLAIANATSGAAAGTGPYIRADVTGKAATVVNWRADISALRVGFAGGKT